MISKEEELLIHEKAFNKRATECLAAIRRYSFKDSRDESFCLNAIEVCRMLAKQDAEDLIKKNL